jgi:putative ABC transport system ATP-binding protein
MGKTEVKAIDRINLTIKDRELMAILGASGSGKSTLMYLIGLLETPTAGQIWLDQTNVSSLNDRQLSKIRNQTIGFVFQQFNLLNKFTVLENVLLPVKYAKTKLNFDPQKRALELLRRFDIYDRRHFFPNKISGGQQQRAAIARALIMNPKIILADEPTGNIDTKTGRLILHLLQQLNQEFNVTVIIVTHDPSVAQITRRQINIKDGRLVKH